MKTRLVLPLLITVMPLLSQPLPGELYKEYVWYNETGDCNGALRVGGNLDYRTLGGALNDMGQGRIQPPFMVDLDRAVRAELEVEKMLCHAGTEGLRVMINDHPPIRIPEAEHIPYPQSAYAHHFEQVVSLPLGYLKEGNLNGFIFEVDTAGHWWPQNLVYGMILRIYYEAGTTGQHATIKFPRTGDTLGWKNHISVMVPPEEKVTQVDLIARYDGPDLEGNGIYRQWHCNRHKGILYNHVGTRSEPPWETVWDTHWIPDQKESISLKARIVREDGYIYMTPPADDLLLKREGATVELCKPFDQPEGWFTREGEFSEKFRVNGEPERATEAKMVFRTWSPGYFNGICINDFLVFIKEGPRYDYFEHHVPITGMHVFTPGENILSTGKTPLYNGEMVHGVEVQWPGIMILIRYEPDNR